MIDNPKAGDLSIVRVSAMDFYKERETFLWLQIDS